jgi:hypothetical protein
MIPKSGLPVFGKDHARIKGSGTPADALGLARTRAACGTRHGERRLAPPSACGRARLPAFHRGSSGGEPTPPFSSRRTSWDVAKKRPLTASACPSPATLSQTGRHAGRAFSRSRPGADRILPPAGAALAPPSGSTLPDGSFLGARFGDAINGNGDESQWKSDAAIRLGTQRYGPHLGRDSGGSSGASCNLVPHLATLGSLEERGGRAREL